MEKSNDKKCDNLFGYLSKYGIPYDEFEKLNFLQKQEVINDYKNGNGTCNRKLDDESSISVRFTMDELDSNTFELVHSEKFSIVKKIIKIIKKY